MSNSLSGARRGRNRRGARASATRSPSGLLADGARVFSLDKIAADGAAGRRRLSRGRRHGSRERGGSLQGGRCASGQSRHSRQQCRHPARRSRRQGLVRGLVGGDRHAPERVLPLRLGSRAAHGRRGEAARSSASPRPRRSSDCRDAAPIARPRPASSASPGRCRSKSRRRAFASTPSRRASREPNSSSRGSRTVRCRKTGWSLACR